MFVVQKTCEHVLVFGQWCSSTSLHPPTVFPHNHKDITINTHLRPLCKEPHECRCSAVLRPSLPLTWTVFTWSSLHAPRILTRIKYPTHIAACSTRAPSWWIDGRGRSCTYPFRNPTLHRPWFGTPAKIALHRMHSAGCGLLSRTDTASTTQVSKQAGK